MTSWLVSLSAAGGVYWPIATLLPFPSPALKGGGRAPPFATWGPSHAAGLQPHAMTGLSALPCARCLFIVPHLISAPVNMGLGTRGQAG